MVGVPEHKDIVGSAFLKFFRGGDDFHGISGRLCGLAETKNDIMAELVRFFVVDVCGEDT